MPDNFSLFLWRGCRSENWGLYSARGGFMPRQRGTCLEWQILGSNKFYPPPHQKSISRNVAPLTSPGSFILPRAAEDLNPPLYSAFSDFWKSFLLLLYSPSFATTFWIRVNHSRIFYLSGNLNGTSPQQSQKAQNYDSMGKILVAEEHSQRKI